MTDSEKITDPGRMVRLLDRLAKQHTLLTVVISGHREQYSSSIVKVSKPYVLLDELIPNTGHELLVAECALDVSGKLDGIDIRFVATLERVENRKNAVTCYVNLPGEIEYLQRRLDYRVHIPMVRTLRVIIDGQAGAVFEGVLHDISHGGAGITFPTGVVAVEPGRLHECAIELPGDVWLYCAAEMRYAKDARSPDRQLIGVRFAELGAAQKQLVGQCIRELERESIRKRAAE
jgi:c-di-GMP-binding flagellar brake protein YcgR